MHLFEDSVDVDGEGFGSLSTGGGSLFGGDDFLGGCSSGHCDY